MASSPSTTDRHVALTVSPFAYPLDEFYAQAGRKLPAIEPIAGEAMPEPCRSLLFHNHDMTPTLESFYRQAIHLEVLRREQRDDFYFREVVLHLDENDQPVEFGAIKINLALFPAVCRREILEERLPLGHILHEHQVPHASRPKAFLQIGPDRFIRDALKLKGSPRLYGRRNSLMDPQQRSLAEIVEILPPVAAAA